MSGGLTPGSLAHWLKVRQKKSNLKKNDSSVDEKKEGTDEF